MIPRIKTGNSFKGAGLYYLHDKRLPGEQVRFSVGRVAWTYTVNTLEEEADAALAEMRQTALSQHALKLDSGNRLDGRPTENTVMTIALAWSPVQSPDRQHMIETGQAFLKHMGWQDHQALFVAHNDTKHPHFHIILNRVHPETGMTLDDNWSKRRAQQWALSYERMHGHIFCLAREAKYERGQVREGRHLHHGEWRQLANSEALPESAEWASLKAAQRDERMAFWKETAQAKRQLRAAVRDEVRKAFAPEWQAYAIHKTERMEAARRFDQETRRALGYYRRHGRKHAGAVQELKARKQQYHRQLREDLARQRAVINGRLKGRTEELSDPVLARFSKDREALYQALLAGQREGKAALREGQSAPPANQNAGPVLTAQQIRGYVDQARATETRADQFGRAQAEVGGSGQRIQSHAPPPEQERQARTEQTTAQVEKSQKDYEQEVRRQYRVATTLARRKADRDHGRDDGGRDR